MALLGGHHNQFKPCHISWARRPVAVGRWKGSPSGCWRRIWVTEQDKIQAKGLILAQNERWRRGLGMQVERERRASA